jgi:hypothetical protein
MFTLAESLVYLLLANLCASLKHFITFLNAIIHHKRYVDLPTHLIVEIMAETKRNNSKTRAPAHHDDHDEREPPTRKAPVPSEAKNGTAKPHKTSDNHANGDAAKPRKAPAASRSRSPTKAAAKKDGPPPRNDSKTRKAPLPKEVKAEGKEIKKRSDSTHSPKDKSTFGAKIVKEKVFVKEKKVVENGNDKPVKTVKAKAKPAETKTAAEPVG